MVHLIALRLSFKSMRIVAGTILMLILALCTVLLSFSMRFLELSPHVTMMNSRKTANVMTKLSKFYARIKYNCLLVNICTSSSTGPKYTKYKEMRSSVSESYI